MEQLFTLYEKKGGGGKLPIKIKWSLPNFEMYGKIDTHHTLNCFVVSKIQPKATIRYKCQRFLNYVQKIH